MSLSLAALSKVNVMVEDSLGMHEIFARNLCEVLSEAVLQYESSYGGQLSPKAMRVKWLEEHVGADKPLIMEWLNGTAMPEQAQLDAILQAVPDDVTLSHANQIRYIQKAHESTTASAMEAQPESKPQMTQEDRWRKKAQGVFKQYQKPR